MLPALLVQAGIAGLTKLVGSALAKVDHPAAKAASEALGVLDTAIATGEISPEQLAEANRHAEVMGKIDSDEVREILREVNATARVEAQSEDKYVRRMRPTFGYIMALTWAVQMIAIAWTIFKTPEATGEVVGALGELTVMWSVGLSVLGVYVYRRSKEKGEKADKGGSNPVSTILGAVAALRGKPK